MSEDVENNINNNNNNENEEEIVRDRTSQEFSCRVKRKNTLILCYAKLNRFKT